MTRAVFVCKVVTILIPIQQVEPKNWMAGCNICGEDGGLSNNCTYCQGTFCSEHVLPEKHNCPALHSAETLGPEFRQAKSDVVLGENDGSPSEHTSGPPRKPDLDDSGTKDDESADQEDTEPANEAHPPSRERQYESSPDVATDGSIVSGDASESASHTASSLVEPIQKLFAGASAGPRYNGDCPHCGQWVSRRRTDRFTTCHRCGWKAGLPVLRIATHWPNWLLWKRRGIRWTKRTLIVAAVLSLAAGLIGMTVGTGIEPVDQTSTEIAEQAGIHRPLSALAANLSVNGSTDISTTASGSTETTQTSTSDGQSANSGTGEIDISAVEAAVHEEINQRRTANGRNPLEHRSDIAEVARYHSRDMATEGYFAHDSPDGESLEDRYRQFGIDCAGGENIAYTYWEETVRTDGGIRYYDTEQELAVGLVNGWMNSTGHRENILRARFESEGIGVSVVEVDGMTRIYATQNFC
ncbi:CAP domain-containing protein [Haloarcula salina]|uniref:CAP domain-containing protein n=1 Tax=Haloarcula salina TaxID=1429914 RepID=UPI003C705A61